MDQVTDATGARSNTSSWETFCREEAKQWASAFLERVRSFKLGNSVTTGVHDSAFTNEFSAAFLEETSILLSVGNRMQSNGEATGLATSLPTASTQSINSSPDVSSSRKSSKKSWFSHLFKWSKSQRTQRTRRSNTASVRFRRTTNAINDDLVRMLNMNAEDSMSAWQSCRLVLLEENGNHQLEVYSPPKSSVPKMSLFCFLIKEVRPATSLEIPDSTSCLVIKSQNHGEYVFDAGSDEKQRRWISIIRAYSANLAPPTNGHLPGYSTGGSIRPRSHSIGAGDHRSSLSATLPPPNALINSQRAGSCRYPSESRLLPPTAADLTNSNESVMVDISTFIRNSPNRSPSRRRQVHSMFVESTLTTQLDSARNTQATPTSQGAGFPYDSPCPSPPPLPKRGMRPKNVAILNSPVLEKNLKPSSPSLRSITTPSEGSPPQRRMSQPHIELHNVSTPELPTNLDSCSVSSSSSALHPVTLADLERRGPLSPSHLRYSSQLSILSEGHGATATKPSNSRVRKISAPLLVPHQPYVERDVVHPELSTTVISKNHLPDNFHASRSTGNRDNDQSESIMPNNDEIRDTAEDMSSKATLNFPFASRSYSPNSQPRTPSDEEPQLDTQRRLVPYTRLNVSSLVAARSNQHPSLRGNEPERSHSQASYNTEGSEDQTQPLYIETTGNESVPSQSSPHTQHPYENWATTPQDVTNLRQLSQFPWFHGMISRNNASQLVLGDGDSGTGQYLVRQSESRESDFVLTFNYHNRAKHLRLTLDGNGCNIQHLWFDDVPGMLEYFKTNSIPLESFWLNNDVKLATFIDRKKSDAFRTTTVVNVARLNRVPPGRSRSFHITMSQAVSTEAPPPLDRSVSSASSTTSTNSLPPGARNGVGLRTLFRSQRSSSAGNMNVHGVGNGATVQRRHSTNAGSILDTRGRGSGRGSMRNGHNTYVYRNY